MCNQIRNVYTIVMLLFSAGAGFVMHGSTYAQGERLPACPKEKNYWTNCFGTRTFDNGNIYSGEWQNNNFNGKGRYTYLYRGEYIGEWKDSKPHGRGVENFPDQWVKSGIWEEGTLIQATPSANVFVTKIEKEIESEELQAEAEAKRKEAEKRAEAEARRLKEAERLARDAIERAPLSREQFTSLRSDLQELVKKKKFDVAEQRLDASCSGKKFATAACRFLFGYILVEKSRSGRDLKGLIDDARTHVEAAFNGDDAEITTLAAAVLLPLVSSTGRDSELEKRVVETLASSEFSTASQKRFAAKRLAEIEAVEARRLKQEEARGLAEERRLAQQGDGTTDDIRCKAFGLKPTTPTYIKCRQEFAISAERERLSKEETKQRVFQEQQQIQAAQARQQQERQRAEELANRGDGTPDHQTCRRYGFTPNTTPYQQCRLQLDLAKQQIERQQAAYEADQRRYEEQLAVYQKEKERRQGMMLLDMSARMLGGQNASNAAAGAAGIAPIQPQRPAMENYIINMPGGRSTNCTYVPSMRYMNCN